MNHPRWGLMSPSLLLTLVMLPSLPIASRDTGAQSTTGKHDAARIARTAWMRDAKWGISMHYIREQIDPRRRLAPAQWNERVENFDVETLAEQVKASGAGYFLITLSQCGGYFLSPNATYDEILGRNKQTTWFPKRDLILDLGKALKKRSIPMIVYLAVEPPIRGDGEAVGVLRPIGQKHSRDGHVISSDEGWRIFAAHWERVVREYSLRWGDLVSGWWFDGCWFGQLSYKNAPNWDSFLTAAKSGNKKAVVSFNHAYIKLRNLPPPQEDFISGEVRHPNRSFVTGPFQDRVVQNHVFSALGSNFGTGNEPRFRDDQLRTIADNFTEQGCLFTWDVPFESDGTLKTAFLQPLKLFDAQVRDRSSRYEQWKARTGGRVVPAGNLAYKRRARLVSRPKDARGGGPDQTSTLLPAGRHIDVAGNGIDGDMNTRAQASNQWSWKFFVDLLREENCSRVRIQFHRDNYPTHFIVRAGNDRKVWRELFQSDAGDGSPVEIRFEASDIRFVEVEAVKPDGPNQKGTQMGITELEVYAE